MSRHITSSVLTCYDSCHSLSGCGLHHVGSAPSVLGGGAVGTGRRGQRLRRVANFAKAVDQLTDTMSVTHLLCKIKGERSRMEVVKGQKVVF